MQNPSLRELNDAKSFRDPSDTKSMGDQNSRLCWIFRSLNTAAHSLGQLGLSASSSELYFANKQDTSVIWSLYILLHLLIKKKEVIEIASDFAVKFGFSKLTKSTALRTKHELI